MPRILVCDLDGVLTDGTVLLDSVGGEQKKIFFRDMDALFRLHRSGWIIACVTGEKSVWVETFKKRLPFKYFFYGCKDKRQAILEIMREEAVEKKDMFYIGDGLSDVSAMREVEISACPSDAALESVAVANVHLKAQGGRGAVEEFVGWLLQKYS